MIKTRLEGVKGIWPDELPSVLWAYRRMIRTPTREKPFRLVFENEDVILVEVGLTNYWISHHIEERNEEEMCL